MPPKQLSAVANVRYCPYEGEQQLQEIVKLIEKDLSEPYSVFTYRYFLYNWPDLCLLARVKQQVVGAIVCRQEQIGKGEHELHNTNNTNDPADVTPRKKQTQWRGYIAMLAVDKKYRKHGIGSSLVKQAIDAMIAKGCQEIMLETEITNTGAIRLYENLGFVREERLVKYYLNGGDAFRLKLWLS